MGLSEKYRYFTEIEERFDVNSLVYKGFRVWPLIRIGLISQFQANYLDDMRGKQILPESLPLINPNQLKELGKYGPVDALFLSRWNEHLAIGSTFYNYLLDPVIEAFRDSYSFLKIEEPAFETHTTYPRAVETVILQKNTTQLMHEHRSSSIENFNGFHALVHRMTGCDLDEQFFIDQAEMLLRCEIYFTQLLKHIKPRSVFLVCYYYLSAMGLIKACRKLGIPTVEIQHGGQLEHGAYAKWTRIPENGYEALPDLFWVWSRKFEQNITDLQPEYCVHHQPVLGGNLWIGKWKSGTFFRLNDEEEEFVSLLKTKNRVVLVTLGVFHMHSKILTEELLSAMRRSSEDWIWLLRMHPDSKDDSHLKEYLIDSLAECGIRNYELELTTRLPLLYVLKHAHCLLSEASSTSLEALCFNVPAAFIHEDGLLCFGDFVRDGVFSYTPDRDSMLDFIRACESPDRINPDYYIETDKETARSAMEMIHGLWGTGKYKKMSDHVLTAIDSINLEAQLNVEGGDLQRAISCYQKVLELDPANSITYNNIGVVAARQGDLQRAFEFLRIALVLDAEDRRIVANYGELMCLIGFHEEAARAYEHYLQHNPLDADIARALVQVRTAGEATDRG
jgi:tetratricopeptide (TPR) repeat protein